MKHVTLMSSLVIIVLLGLVHAYPWSEEEEQSSFDNQQASDVFFNNIQRRRWCGGWNDPCNPDAKVSYAKCCDEMRCVCGILWKQGKCQCKSPSLFGR